MESSTIFNITKHHCPACAYRYYQESLNFNNNSWIQENSIFIISMVLLILLTLFFIVLFTYLNNKKMNKLFSKSTLI
ncbi:Uncharacterised protein [Mycoplasmopsis maculosa]|uniref:Uncharacterized protein n=1 Tax=Mycoplasmopsis maculosa TaxID=114885 RepID=A0A449B3X2_9BACT|nr:hypothetical protein [Mycoplasmopsis maculosa]VEU75265.1 Uncharacterised protein [Mycoplasmopsis maculosa]